MFSIWEHFTPQLHKEKAALHWKFLPFLQTMFSYLWVSHPEALQWNVQGANEGWKGDKSLNLQDSQVARTLENGPKRCMGISSSILNKKHSTPFQILAFFCKLCTSMDMLLGWYFMGSPGKGCIIAIKGLHAKWHCSPFQGDLPNITGGISINLLTLEVDIERTFELIANKISNFNWQHLVLRRLSSIISPDMNSMGEIVTKH